MANKPHSIPLEECIKTAGDISMDAAYDASKAKAPRRKRQLDHQVAFWSSIKCYLEELKSVKEQELLNNKL